MWETVKRQGGEVKMPSAGVQAMAGSGADKTLAARVCACEHVNIEVALPKYCELWKAVRLAPAYMGHMPYK